MITEPRKTSESSAFTHIDVFNYLRHIKSDALIVHRINECDERKGTNYVNKYLINANEIADSTIFVSYWLKDIFEEQGINKKNNTVIYAGANKKIFNPDGFIPGMDLQKSILLLITGEQIGIKDLKHILKSII